VPWRHWFERLGISLFVGKWLLVARVYRNGGGSGRRVAATTPDEGCVFRRCSALTSRTPVSASTGIQRCRAGDLSAWFAHAVWTASRDVTRMSTSSGPSAIPPRIPVASAFEMQMGPSMICPEDCGTSRWRAAHVCEQIIDRIRQMSSTIGFRGSAPYRCFRIPAQPLSLHYARAAENASYKFVGGSDGVMA